MTNARQFHHLESGVADARQTPAEGNMTSAMIDAIAAHRAAYDAFQIAPSIKVDMRVALHAEDCEAEALAALLGTVPQARADLDALKVHLDWYVVEEAPRRGRSDIENQPFALHAAITLAMEGAA